MAPRAIVYIVRYVLGFVKSSDTCCPQIAQSGLRPQPKDEG